MELPVDPLQVQQDQNDKELLESHLSTLIDLVEPADVASLS
jgi:hypothetical protein